MNIYDTINSYVGHMIAERNKITNIYKTNGQK